MTQYNTFRFDQPTPGQSLTTEPGARPWENPAEFSDPLDALDYYTGKLLKPERMPQLVEILETGFPVADLVDAITLGGVMEGKTSIDNAVLVSPHLFDIIVAVADSTEIKYTKGTERKESNDDDILVNKVISASNKEKQALENYEKEQIDAFFASQPSGGLMSRRVEEKVEE